MIEEIFGYKVVIDEQQDASTIMLVPTALPIDWNWMTEEQRAGWLFTHSAIIRNVNMESDS